MASESATGLNAAVVYPDSIDREVENGTSTSVRNGTCTRVPPSWGAALNESDDAMLASSWITREVAEQAMLRRVDAQQGRDVVGPKGKT